MQWVFVLLATLATVAALTYLDDKRRTERQEPKAPLTTKAAIFFSVLLIYIGIFYWFDEDTKKSSKSRHEGGSASASTITTDTERIQNIKEDCYDGRIPF